MDASIRQSAAAQVGKHRRLLSTGGRGRVLSALMLPPLWLATPAGYGVLTTTGRKTGKARRKCVRVQADGDRAYLISLRPPHLAMTNPGVAAAWVHNIRANPRVRLRISSGEYRGMAREVVDSGERARARALLCDTVVPTDYGECTLHLRGMPNRTKIQELHRYWFDTGILFAIDLKESRQ
jgi:deazaflavin-dependent oxidoreductase (nitroreductase family)